MLLTCHLIPDIMQISVFKQTNERVIYCSFLTETGRSFGAKLIQISFLTLQMIYGCKLRLSDTFCTDNLNEFH